MFRLIFKSFLCVAVSSVFAGNITVGETYPIAEPDLYKEIKTRAGNLKNAGIPDKDWANDDVFEGSLLPVAIEDKSRLFDPTYLLPRAMIDAEGRTLYPKGYPVNVYEKFTMPGRFIVINNSDEHFNWLKTVANLTESDMVLLAGGNVIHARKSQKIRFYALDQRGIERLGLKAVPSIVSQEKTQLRVNEYAVD